MIGIYEAFLEYEAVINAASMLCMLGGIFFSEDHERPTKQNLIAGGITFLSFSTLALSVFVNIIEKGF
tara:strand:+ start:6440 stop:6643 length:204 start_codon:yes stop_codon:yes gene_type:complete